MKIRRGIISQNLALESRKSVALLKRSDQLWIDTDGSATKHGIGATLYVHCEGILMLAGFFSAKLITAHFYLRSLIGCLPVPKDDLL
jgi:hypothetical protein